MPIYGLGYLAARPRALARSKGVCQFCGMRDATETHHWAVNYPSDDEITSDDLTALCRSCHEIATSIRRFTRSGGSIFEFSAELKKGLKNVL